MPPMPSTLSGATRPLAVLATLAGRVARVALGLLLLAMVLLNVANAVSRYLLGQAIEGSDELLVFGMVWVVFLGAVFVTADRRHLSFDVLGKFLPPRLHSLIRVAGDLLMIVLLGFVALQSLDVVDRLAALNQRSMAAGIPTFIPHSAILIGFGLSALALLVQFLACVAGRGRHQP